MKHPFLIGKNRRNPQENAETGRSCRESTLDLLRPGETGTVSAVGGAEAMRRRLQDMGVLEGTQIACVGESPWGNPKAYLIRGCVIALRVQDGSQIRMREGNP